jgi:hypothetical protein
MISPTMLETAKFGKKAQRIFVVKVQILSQFLQNNMLNMVFSII